MIAKLERDKEVPTGNILVAQDIEDNNWEYYHMETKITLETAIQLRDELTYLIERYKKECACNTE